jgi:isoamylase
MTDEEWNKFNHSLMVFLSGYLIGTNGEIVQDDFFLLCFNAHHDSVPFQLPTATAEAAWECLVDTANEDGFMNERLLLKDKVIIESRSIRVLRLMSPKNSNPLSVLNEFVKRVDKQSGVSA